MYKMMTYCRFNHIEHGMMKSGNISLLCPFKLRLFTSIFFQRLGCIMWRVIILLTGLTTLLLSVGVLDQPEGHISVPPTMRWLTRVVMSDSHC